MKKFLEKHVLFPRKMGFQPYVWLIFMLPTLTSLIHYALWQKIAALLLILAFLKAYRDAYFAKNLKLLTVSFVCQLLIVLILAVNPWFSTWGIQIFTGFEMGFWKISNKRWRVFLTAYFLVAGLSYFLPYGISGWTGIDSSNLAWILVGTVFLLVAPFFSKMFSRAQTLSSENKDLENRIRQLERERIAYDLHDNLGQTFSTISLQAELAQKLVDKKPEAAKAELAKIADNARASLTLVREIVSDLKTESVAEILQTAQQNLALAGIELSVTGNGEGFPSPTAEVLKEALTNIARHSQATQAQVTFVSADRNYQLTVNDNGVGIGSSQPSHGLLGMKKRVEDVGGTISVSADKGTTITVTLRKDKK